MMGAIVTVCFILLLSTLFHEPGVRTSNPKIAAADKSEESAGVITVNLAPCNCQRTFYVSSNASLQHPLSSTTCNQFAHLRGNKQKVIAFTFFEKADKDKLSREKSGNSSEVNGFFFNGFQNNIVLLPVHYPGWTIRIYHDIEETDPLHNLFCEFSCKYPTVDFCYVNKVPSSYFRGK